MPSFDEIFEEAHRLAGENRMPVIASAITQGKHPGDGHTDKYEAIIDRAYKNLCAEEKAKEWEILRVTEPREARQ